MNTYKDKTETMKRLVPLYLNGQLTGIQKEAFEKTLAGSKELKRELEAWEDIGKAYERISQELPQPSRDVYARLAARIAEEKEKPRVGLLERFMPSPALSFGLVAAQLLIIIALGTYIASQKTEFRTLSAPSTAARQALKINIVFNDKASVKEINALLTQLNCSIIEGPAVSGLYVIGIEADGDINGVLSSLRKSKIVVMAGKAYQ